MNTEVKVAIIGTAKLIIAALISGYFLIGSQTDDNPSAKRRSNIDVTISANLYDEDYPLKQDLSVEIDGEHKGDLSLETDVEPEDSMSISLVAPKSHHYEIGGTTEVTLNGGNLEYPVSGEGEIDVLDEENQTFDIVLLGAKRGTFLVELKRI
jgi:hypothetical protein